MAPLTAYATTSDTGSCTAYGFDFTTIDDNLTADTMMMTSTDTSIPLVLKYFYLSMP